MDDIRDMDLSLASTFSRKMMLLMKQTIVSCKIHEEEVIQRYCTDCSKFVCLECMITDHNGHKFKKLDEIIEEKRKDLGESIKRAKEQTLPDIASKQIKAKSLRKQVLETTASRMDEVKARAEVLKSAVDSACDKLLSELKQSETEYEKMFSEADSAFSDSTRELNEVITKYSNMLQDDQVEYIIKGCYEIDSEIEKLLPHVSVPCEGPPPLYYSRNENEIEAIFGKLEDEADFGSDFIDDDSTSTKTNGKTSPKFRRFLSRKRNSAFRIKKRDGGGRKVKVCLSADIRSPSRISLENDKLIVKSISNKDCEASWLLTEDNTDNTCQVLLLEKDGAPGVPIDFEFDVSSIVVTFGGSLLLAESKSPRIHLLENMKLSIWKDLSPFIVTGLCLIRSGGTAVSVSDKYDYVIRKNSIRAVMILNDDNQQTDMLEYCGNSSKRHFTLPTKIAENRNSDLCVIDRLSDSLGRLVVITRDGKLRFDYKGPTDSDCDPFDPIDVAAAGDGCILVVDKIRGVHQVTSRGTLARLLLTERQGLVSPRSVTVDEERKAWVGCENGIVIRVWTFLDPRHRPLTNTDGIV